MMRYAFWIGACLAAGQAMAEECAHSKWGAEDEIGAANLITPERVAAAAKLVKKGESHPLGIVIDPNMPAFPPRAMMLQVVQPGQQGGQRLTQFGYEAVYNDDVAQLWFGIGSQLDGLGHYGVGGLYYNCNRDRDFAQLTGLTKLGIHTIPPLIGRGVLIDMARHFGKPALAAGEAFDTGDIRAAAEAQGVAIGEGDVVLFHTGWTDAKLATDPRAWVAGEPGITPDAAEYLASLNILAVGADTWGLEVIPPREGERPFWGHAILLKENGIYILETMNTGRLAEERVHEFLFVLGQARVKGAVQMMINPVAMW